MNKKAKWFMAASLATMITGSSIVMAAVNTDNQDIKNAVVNKMANHKEFKGHGDFAGYKADRTELLNLLKIDDNTFKSERKAGKTMLEIANEHNISEQTLVDFFVTHMSARIDERVKDGKLDADKAQAMKDKLSQRVEKMIKSKGHKEHKNHKGHGHMDMTELLNLLQIDAKTLHGELKQGKTLINIAAEHGVSESQLKDTLMQIAAKHIDEGVAKGRISADKADAMKAKAMTRIENMISGKYDTKKDIQF